MHKIQIGTWLEWLIDLFTLGLGKQMATWIAVDILGKQNCGCCERKQWLNRLTNKSYDGQCNEIKLF
jgi:hypothetical protein